MKKRIMLAGFGLCLLAAPAFGWFCGGKIVKPGDPVTRVLRYCGDPDYVSARENSTRETWYYRGHGKNLGRKLVIRDGEVYKIYYHSD